MNDSSKLTDFAARIATQVNRLFSAGHQSARAYAQKVAEEYGIRSFGLLIDLRRPLLYAGGITAQDAHVINRYQPPQDLSTILQRHVSDGLLLHQNSFFVPTSLGHAVLERLTSALNSGLSERWAGIDTLPATCGLADRVVRQATNTHDEYSAPSFRAQRPDVRPGDLSSPFRLWDSLLVLRHLRADCHHLAWSAMGLEATEASALNELWRARGPVPSPPAQGMVNSNDAPIQSLLQRGWVELIDGSWVISTEGRAASWTIERRTNVSAGLAYGVLDAVERDSLLASLSALP